MLYDPFRACPMCAQANASTMFKLVTNADGVEYPVLVRNCIRCGYTWYEEPLVAVQTQTAQA